MQPPSPRLLLECRSSLVPFHRCFVTKQQANHRGGRERKCMALPMLDILPWLSWVRSLVQIMGKSSETEIGAFSRQISSILLVENLLASSIVLVASIDRPLMSILFSRLPTGTMQSNMFHRKNVCGFFLPLFFCFSYSAEKNESGREKKT